MQPRAVGTRIVGWQRQLLDCTVFTGSHNWTDHALRHNDEAMVKIDNAAVYEVSVTNRSVGQPFTPPVVAVHGGDFELFEAGTPASAGLMRFSRS